MVQIKLKFIVINVIFAGLMLIDGSVLMAQQAISISSSASLRVMSLNLAHGRKHSLNQMLVSTATTRDNLDDIAAVIQRENVDIVAFQEADGPSRWSGKFNHIAYLAEKSGLSNMVLSPHATSWLFAYGTALISKRSFSDEISHSFAPTPPTTRKGFTLVQVEWPVVAGTTKAVPVDIVSVHLDFSRKAVREQQIAEIAMVLEQRNNPVVIMGDFNSDWLAGAKVVQTLAEEARLHAYQPLSEHLASYPSSNRRLDWILLSDDLEFVSYQSLPDALSDHLAVIADIRFK